MRSPFETVSEVDVDDSWVYPDRESLVDYDTHDVEDPTNDADLIELRTDPHAFAFLTAAEYQIVDRRYGLTRESEPIKEIARDLGVTHAEARELLGSALNKMRDNMKEMAG